jgi:hypothetical protein
VSETTRPSPGTEAGRAMLRDPMYRFAIGHVLAIEAEARAALLGEVREGVEGLPITDLGHWGIYLNGAAVLALLDTLADGGPK